ncbi:hypothetical protein PSYPI_28224 [Pseudomonas syringae pv. pisi str. 1704B]|uniref:Uncharacterized protein n=1 Tax=Pseudomonas syringae pv. pisi str. 1704B TaxID=629263 RepID=F3GFZ8_PSESJ|nr:hypothetical protein PSYPI_28224 [Pseudomonas syringae pv. pisi str. 1704B]
MNFICTRIRNVLSYHRVDAICKPLSIKLLTIIPAAFQYDFVQLTGVVLINLSNH